MKDYPIGSKLRAIKSLGNHWKTGDMCIVDHYLPHDKGGAIVTGLKPCQYILFEYFEEIDPDPRIEKIYDIIARNTSK